ncbi:TPA: tail fiber assembly protein, partial [Escherichia coli]|nr:tail fiber assembly protein [Escherichia coli]
MYKFDPKNALFYPAASISDYKLSEDEIATFTDISEEDATEFLGFPPTGKIRGSDGYGNPAWVEIPPPTHEEQIAAAELEKQQLINQVNEYINSKQWPGKSVLGRLKDDELTQYNLWLDYLDALEAV